LPYSDSESNQNVGDRSWDITIHRLERGYTTKQQIATTRASTRSRWWQIMAHNATINCRRGYSSIQPLEYNLLENVDLQRGHNNHKLETGDTRRFVVWNLGPSGEMDHTLKMDQNNQRPKVSRVLK
jgi:hypothetical protein